MTMSLKTKTKESTTVDGSVEYQAVECHRCGYDTPTDKAVVAYLPSHANEKHKIHSNNYFKVEYASDGGQIPFCPECAASVFGGEPSSNYQRKLDEFVQEREWRFLVIGIAHLVLLVFAALGLLYLLFGAPAA